MKISLNPNGRGSSSASLDQCIDKMLSSDTQAKSQSMAVHKEDHSMTLSATQPADAIMEENNTEMTVIEGGSPCVIGQMRRVSYGDNSKII